MKHTHTTALFLAALLVSVASNARAQNCGGPVLPPHVQAGDRYGVSAAWDGGWAVVGAEGSDLAAPDAGALQVLRSLGVGYLAHAQELLPSSPLAGEAFGHDVDLRGARLVGGAPGAGAGRARIFQRSGSTWLEDALVAPSDGNAGDRFGAGVALWGSWLAVGAPDADASGVDDGAVYLFELVGASWVERQKLTSSDPNDLAHFGACVAIDGGSLMVGAPGNDHAGLDSGAVFVFVLVGGTWTPVQTLTPSDAAAGQEFGAALALERDLAAIGAPGDDTMGSDAGAVYSFRRAMSPWAQTHELHGQGAQPGDRFGASVDCEEDGGGFGVIVSGAPGTDLFAGADAGLVAGYQGSPGNPWIFLPAGVPPDATPGDEFGRSVALEGFAALGGAWKHPSAGTDAGSASGFSFTGDCFSNGAFCGGDGSGATCPCANPSLPLDGCANSSGRGATLISWGFSSLSDDTLSFGAWNLLPNQPVLLFVGSVDLGGGGGIPFGGGLRCAGMDVVRLGTEVPDSFGYAEWGPGLANASGAPPGNLRFFQAWYRDPAAGACSMGFNLSNAWVRVITP